MVSLIKHVACSGVCDGGCGSGMFGGPPPPWQRWWRLAYPAVSWARWWFPCPKSVSLHLRRHHGFPSPGWRDLWPGPDWAWVENKRSTWGLTEDQFECTYRYFVVFLLGDLCAVRGPVLVRVELVLVVILLRFQGNRLGSSGGRALATGILCRGRVMGWALSFRSRSIHFVFFLRGWEVRVLLSATGTCKYLN